MSEFLAGIAYVLVVCVVFGSLGYIAAAYGPKPSHMMTLGVFAGLALLMLILVICLFKWS